MDALSGLLDGPRAREAFLLRAVLDPPWALRIRDEAALCLIAVLRGQVWVLPATGGATRLGPGDIAVARGPEHYTVADPPGTGIRVVIHPGQRCTTPDGRDLSAEMDLGVRTWGTDPDGADAMLVGAYELTSTVGRRLLDTLPAVLVLPAGQGPATLVDLLAGEAARDDPGQSAVLDRLLDLVLIAVLRDWFARPEARPPSWFGAQSDPLVGRVLRLVHDRPDHPWTVAALAAQVGVSRATLARRFTGLVGEPPMGYLAGWRLALAADLLLEPDATIAAVARRVGYATPFGLSAAFKRAYGISPQQHRRLPHAEGARSSTAGSRTPRGPAAVPPAPARRG